MRIQGLAGLLVIAIFESIEPGVARAQPPTDLQKQMWSAQWITSPDGPQRDQSVLHFRKLIELAQQPEHFVVHVSADNQFILYVNQQRLDGDRLQGHFVLAELVGSHYPAFGRGHTPQTGN